MSYIPYKASGNFYSYGTIRYHFFMIMVPYGTTFSQKRARNHNVKNKKALKIGLF